MMARLCHAIHSCGDTQNGMKPRKPITRISRRPWTTPPCSASWPTNVTPPMLPPIASDTTGHSSHGTWPDASAQVNATMIA